MKSLTLFALLSGIKSKGKLIAQTVKENWFYATMIIHLTSEYTYDHS
jgi:hypothetical protein